MLITSHSSRAWSALLTLPFGRSAERRILIIVSTPQTLLAPKSCTFGRTNITLTLSNRFDHTFHLCSCQLCVVHLSCRCVWWLVCVCVCSLRALTQYFNLSCGKQHFDMHGVPPLVLLVCAFVPRPSVSISSDVIQAEP